MFSLGLDWSDGSDLLVVDNPCCFGLYLAAQLIKSLRMFIIFTNISVKFNIVVFQWKPLCEAVL